MLRNYLVTFDDDYEPVYQYEAVDFSSNYRSEVVGRFDSHDEAIAALKSRLAEKFGGYQFDPDVSNGWQLRHANSPNGKNRGTSKVDGCVNRIQIK